jgi:LPXTG-site transpeptidase (sortase) family protein
MDITKPSSGQITANITGTPRLRVGSSRKGRLVPALLAVLVIFGLLLPTALPALAAPVLTITPLTWNIAGLDNENFALGPNSYLAGARVCNTGDTPAENVIINFIWDPSSTNTHIQLSGPATLTAQTLAAGACRDFYYTIVVTQVVESLGKTRGYRISAEATGIAPVLTPENREVYVEELVPDQNLLTSSFTGPSSIEVGQTYTYTLVSTTGGVDFSQLVNSITFPPQYLRLRSASTIHTGLTGSPIPSPYIDACGWENDITDPDYRVCTNNTLVSGVITTTFQVEVLAAGTGAIDPVLYGVADDTFVYANDFGLDRINFTATPAQDPTATATHTGTPPTATLTGTQFTPTFTPTFTITPSPTHTGSVTPLIIPNKEIAPTQVARGNSLVFTIRLTNNGTTAAEDIVLTDNISTYTYLEITAVSTSKGSATRTSTQATINIPSLAPGELATITITVRVRDSVVGTPEACNIASVVFRGGAITTPQARNSQRICFRVLGATSGVLPGTGEIALDVGSSKPDTPWLLASLVVGLGALVVFLTALKAVGKPGGQAFSRLMVSLVLGAVAATAYLASTGAFPSQNASRPAEPVLVAEVVVTEGETSPQLATTPTRNPLDIAPPYIFNLPDPEPHKTLPAFPIPSPTLVSTPRPGEAAVDISPIRWLSIPALNLTNAKVAYVPYDGYTWLIEGLRDEIAWMGDTSWPGLGGNTALAGHVTVRGMGNGPFRYLQDLVYGDTITVYTEKNIYTYAIRDKQVVPDTSLSILDQTSQSRLTLITCINWSEDLEQYIDRLVVVADLVKVEPLSLSSQ